jgi:hypothetical protein
MNRAPLTVAGRVHEGDSLVLDGESVTVDRIKRAQGRKPRHGGENLHFFVSTGDLIKVNSLSPVRVIRQTT